MIRQRRWVWIAGTTCLVGVTACATQTRIEDEPTNPPLASWTESYRELGREVYARTCACCHDEGAGNAPVIGDREAWSDRSPLWSAVLFEHAKNGYLDMPARGGHPELTEGEVEAAGEYLLTATYPELPVD